MITLRCTKQNECPPTAEDRIFAIILSRQTLRFQTCGLHIQRKLRHLNGYLRRYGEVYFRNDGDSYRGFSTTKAELIITMVYMANAARDATLELVLKALIN